MHVLDAFREDLLLNEAQVFGPQERQWGLPAVTRLEVRLAAAESQARTRHREAPTSSLKNVRRALLACLGRSFFASKVHSDSSVVHVRPLLVRMEEWLLLYQKSDLEGDCRSRPAALVYIEARVYRHSFTTSRRRL